MLNNFRILEKSSTAETLRVVDRTGKDGIIFKMEDFLARDGFGIAKVGNWQDGSSSPLAIAEGQVLQFSELSSLGDISKYQDLVIVHSDDLLERPWPPYCRWNPNGRNELFQPDSFPQAKVAAMKWSNPFFFHAHLTAGRFGKTPLVEQWILDSFVYVQEPRGKEAFREILRISAEKFPSLTRAVQPSGILGKFSNSGKFVEYTNGAAVRTSDIADGLWKTFTNFHSNYLKRKLRMIPDANLLLALVIFLKRSQQRKKGTNQDGILVMSNELYQDIIRGEGKVFQREKIERALSYLSKIDGGTFPYILNVFPSPVLSSHSRFKNLASLTQYDFSLAESDPNDWLDISLVD